METIQQFAERHRLRVSRDGCNDPIISGRRTARHHIFDNGDGRLGVLLMFDGSPAKWTNAKKKAVAVGLIVRQDGGSEGTMLFDSANLRQSRMALNLTGARIKRILTAEQKEVLAFSLQAARQAKAA